MTPRYPRAMQPRAWIEVDHAALVHNVGVFRRAIAPGTRLAIAVKANGYGHGLVIAAQAAIDGGADQLMVVSLDEALGLRAAGIDAPILIVYPIHPADIDEAVRADVQISASGVLATRHLLAAWLASPARARGDLLRIHVEVDTGIGRGGVRPADLVEVVGRIDATPATALVGIWSHLSDGADPARSVAQVRDYEAALAAVAATGRALPLRHIGATAGVIFGTGPAYDLVRVGLGFYGEAGVEVGSSPVPDAVAALAAELRPALTLVALPVRVEWLPVGATVGYGGEWAADRPSLIATLPIGYADGWTRTSWPGAAALVRGRRVPLVGRVSMDSVTADVTDVVGADGVDGGELRLDERFVLLGGQDAERITAGELARRRGTISYEVLSAMGPRFARRLVGRDGVVEDRRRLTL